MINNVLQKASTPKNNIRVMKMEYLIDLHIHTIASGHAYSTIEEIAKAAKIKNMKAIAITDHGPSAPGAPHRYYFSNLKVVPEYIEGVRILKGAETNIINEDGDLDLEKFDLQKLDIVLAGFHKQTGYEENEDILKNTKTLLNCIRAGNADILTHLGNPKYLFEYEQIVKAAKEYSVAIEINNSSFTVSRKGSKENCTKIIELCKKYGNYISLGSDAHISFDVGNLSETEKLVKDIGYNKKLILNSEIEILDKFLSDRRK